MFPMIGGYRTTGTPVKFSETPGRPTTAAPKLGEHTADVLKALLDVEDEVLERLQATNVICAA